MRRLTVTCDVCGSPQPEMQPPGAPGAAPATTWWTLEDMGHPTRTGPMDFCSLVHLQQWVSDPRVQSALALDFTDGKDRV
jgi:hypothetical protein